MVGPHYNPAAGVMWLQYLLNLLCGCCVLGNVNWLALYPAAFPFMTFVMGFHCIWLFLNWMLCNSAFFMKTFMFSSLFHFRFFFIDLFYLMHRNAYKFCLVIPKHLSDDIFWTMCECFYFQVKRALSLLEWKDSRHKTYFRHLWKRQTSK